MTTMKSLSFSRVLPLVLGLALSLALSATAQAGPKIEQWMAATGARVSYVASHELPILDITLDFAAGSAADPAGKNGLASFTNSLLDAGAGELNEQAISDKKADLGLILHGSTDEDRASFSLRTLSASKERDASVTLAAKVLAHPAYPQAILERDRTRSIASLKEALTKPSTLASRAFESALYAGHPYGGLYTEKTLNAITRDDLIAFHARYYSAKNVSIAIVGDVDRAMAEKIAVALTRDLPKGGKVDTILAPAQTKASEKRIKNPSTQAHILVGQPGLSRDDPDYFALLLGNHVLGGGGFTSRLMSEVREKRGLVYDVHSYFEPRRVAGPFRIGLQTKGSQRDEALKVVREVLEKFIKEGPTEAELKTSRDNLVNGFGLRLDSNSKILSYVSVIGFYGLPVDWLDQYPRALSAITREQVRDAFARRIHPDQLVTVISGGDGDQKSAPAKP